MLTRDDLEQIRNVIKEETSGMATKTDLIEIKKTMATKEDIKDMATKSDLSELRKVMATKADLAEIRKIMATKEDIKDMATKSGLKELEATMRKDIKNLSDHVVEYTEAMIEPTADILNDHEARITKLEKTSPLN